MPTSTNILLTLLASTFTLGVLIVIHEWAHYRVAVACGVRVLRFSLGFGHPLWRWQHEGGTEFVIGSFPFGGYVQMLDGSNTIFAPEERHCAFDARPLWARTAILVAGPVANLLLALLLYSIVSWVGTQEPLARLATPPSGSVAQQMGLTGGEVVLATTVSHKGAWEAVRSLNEVQWVLRRAALNGHDVWLRVRKEVAVREVLLPPTKVDVYEEDEHLIHAIGVVVPWTAPIVGEVLANSVAERIGLLQGDMVRNVDGVVMKDGAQLRAVIRASVRDGQALIQRWQVERAGHVLELEVLPEVVQEPDGTTIGRIGAYVGGEPEWVMVRYGLWQGLQRGIIRTWDVAWLTLRTLGHVVTGQASIKNFSGPLTMADYARRSASAGLVQYLAFLAFVSVSLGMLNLLPLPGLDGGQLMYCLWEAVTGRAVSDVWFNVLQRIGFVLLVALMTVALGNDIVRYATQLSD